jgi:iron(III) transport system ATP-binding protein
MTGRLQSAPMISVRLEHLDKSFGGTPAVRDVDLQIQAGELFFLLGPSGCGKSTLLRLIAGLQAPTRGRIFFNERDVTPLGTDKRNAVMCFQSYALWPHMTVRNNVRFGLEVRGTEPAAADARVEEMLALVQMESLGERKPNQLSGGQQQRVALARALAVKPDCLLLDEPLSNLDAQLRLEMRSEIRRICKSSGVTTIYVTHDQKEALSIADRIAVLREGKLAQVGTPDELYRSPHTSFVAAFIGQTNVLKGQASGDSAVDTAAGRLLTRGSNAKGEVMLSIRPEQIRIAGPSPRPGHNRLVGKLIESTFLGESSEHVLLVNGQRLRFTSAPPLLDPPPELAVEFDARDVVVMTE